MGTKETVMAWIAFLAVMATAFVQLRNEMRDLTIQVTQNGAKIDTIREYCCDKGENQCP